VRHYLVAVSSNLDYVIVSASIKLGSLILLGLVPIYLVRALQYNRITAMSIQAKVKYNYRLVNSRI